jgi:hypothetical protein
LIPFRPAAISLVFCLWSIGALAGCASLSPATYPPHIKNTPGAYVVVTEGHIEAGIFRLDYPRTWKAVKLSPADSDFLHLAFAAPDGGSVKLLHVKAGDASHEQLLTLPNGIKLQVQINPAAEPSPRFLAQAQQLIKSIRS